MNTPNYHPTAHCPLLKQFVFSVGCLLLVLQSFAQSTFNNQSTCTVQIQLTQTLNNTAISAALIEVTPVNSTTNKRNSWATDVNGKVLLTLPPQKDFWVRIHKTGFQEKIISVSTKKAPCVPQHVSLTLAIDTTTIHHSFHRINDSVAQVQKIPEVTVIEENIKEFTEAPVLIPPKVEKATPEIVKKTRPKPAKVKGQTVAKSTNREKPVAKLDPIIPRAVEASTERIPSNFEDIGTVAFDIPPEMFVDSVYKLRVIVSFSENDSTVTIGIPDKTLAVFPAKALQVGMEMEAELVDPLNSFNLVASNPGPQDIDPLNKTEWYWTAVPKEEGVFPLQVIIHITKDIHGDIKERSFEVLYENYEISCKQPHMFGYILSAVIGLICCIAGGLFWAFKQKRVAKRSTIDKIRDRENPSKAQSIFILYAEEDEAWADRLYNHLLGLVRIGDVTIWYKKLLQPGESIENVLGDQLKQTDLVLVLMSEDLFSADFYEDMMERIMFLKKSNKLSVIPLILRHYLWQLDEYMGQLQALPKNQKPIASRDWDGPDEAIAQIVEEMF